VAKLYFRYGTVSSAKTLNLLAVAHNYERQGKKVIVIKPGVDDRSGVPTVASRAGLERQADFIVGPGTKLDPERFRGVHAVLVDEAQFLSEAFIEELRKLTIRPGVPVLCYGLRTDFRSRLFEGARRLFELADSIEEVKTTCSDCNRKGVLNLRTVNGRPTTDGPSVQIGGHESYRPMCYEHWQQAISNPDAYPAR
jgi:thymidine kinase